MFTLTLVLIFFGKYIIFLVKLLHLYTLNADVASRWFQWSNNAVDDNLTMVDN